MTTELNEPILADNYPVYGGYTYVADGKPVVCPLGRAKVADLKKELGAKEIRRCDIVGRNIPKKQSTQRGAPKQRITPKNHAMANALKKLGL